jgi:DNA-binding response OmpR family regulator
MDTLHSRVTSPNQFTQTKGFFPPHALNEWFDIDRLALRVQLDRPSLLEIENMAKILVVEDDSAVSLVIEEALIKERHAVELLADGQQGLEYLKTYVYDLVILDWVLPLVNGIEICHEFRSAGGQTPVLMLTGNKDIGHKKKGFGVGVDDYLTKPFEMDELVARVRALLRRARHVANDSLTVRNLAIDLKSGIVTRGGEAIHFLPKELALLEFFVRHPNELFSAEALINRVWSSESEASSEAVRAYIARVRQKIDTPGQPSLISTVHGAGYRFEP